MHGITPTNINKAIRDRMIEKKDDDDKGGRRSKKSAPKHQTVIHLNKDTEVILEEIVADEMTPYDRSHLAKQLNRRMKQAANEMDYELAAAIRDKIQELEQAS
jgi:excinuclease UvrABC helicase subunit UvrB